MKKRILAIGHSFVLAQNRDVLRAVHDSGEIEVTCLAPRFFYGDLRPIEIEAEPSQSTMRLLPIDCYLTNYIHFFSYNIFQVEQLLNRESFDAVYLWEEPYIVSGFTLAHVFHKHKLPYFFYSCQNILKKYPWPFSLFEKLAQRNSVGMLACGVGVAEVLAAKQAARVEKLPFFVSLDRFQPLTKTQKAEGLSRLGLSEGITIGFMGRLVEEKGIATFLKVAESFSLRKCNIIIIGSGPLKEKLEVWCAEKPNVKLLQLRHDEVPGVLGLMDILLCPSQTRVNWKEQFGRMIVEAFACGVAVIGSDSGEIPHVIGEAGIVVGESDESGWIAAAHMLAESPEKRKVFAERGILRAKKYSVDAVADELVSVLKSVLNWE